LLQIWFISEIVGKKETSSIIDAALSVERLCSLRSRLSAAYKGINALLKILEHKIFALVSLLNRQPSGMKM